MCSLWIVNYKHKFIIAIIFFYYWPFLDLFWISSSLNDIKYQLCYLKRCLYTNSICSLLQVFFIITCSFSVLVENCILLPKGIDEFVVFLCNVHVWFWFFTLLPRFLLLVIKRQFFQRTKLCFRVHFFFQVQKCSIEILFKKKKRPVLNIPQYG